MFKCVCDESGIWMDDETDRSRKVGRNRVETSGETQPVGYHSNEIRHDIP